MYSLNVRCNLCTGLSVQGQVPLSEHTGQLLSDRSVRHESQLL